MLSQKFIRFVILVFDLLSELKFYAEENFNSRIDWQTLKKLKRARVRWGHLVKRTLVVYLVVKQLLLIALQYNHYFLAMKLKKSKSSFGLVGLKGFNSSSSSSSNNNNDNITISMSMSRHTNGSLQASSTFWSLEQKIWANERALGFFGEPFKNMPFFVECGQLVASLSLAAFYSCTSFYSRFVAPINMSLLRALADEKRELRLVDKLIDEERERTIRIAYFLRLYNHFETDSDSELLFDLEADKNNDNEYNNNNNNNDDQNWMLNDLSTVNYSLENYFSLVRALKRTQTNNSLIPINRRPQWLAFMRKLYVNSYWGLLVALLVFYLSLKRIWILSRVGRVEQQASWAAILCHVELHLMVHTLVILLHIASYSISCALVDLSYAAVKLRQSIESCICLNGRLISELSSNQQSNQREAKIAAARLVVRKKGGKIGPIITRRPNDLKRQQQNRKQQQQQQQKQQRSPEKRREIEQINENLLQIIMSYRIFVRHVTPMTKFSSLTITIIASFFIISPVYLILHAPFWSSMDCIVVIVISWVTVIWHDTQMVPVCYYHARVKNLLRTMFSLLAHISQCDQANAANEITYNPFLVSIIRREVSATELAFDRVSIKFFNVPIGYKHLLTMHFWAALLSAYAYISRNAAVNNLAKMESVQSSLRLFG